jgi:hypothetical protein
LQSGKVDEEDPETVAEDLPPVDPEAARVWLEVQQGMRARMPLTAVYRLYGRLRPVILSPTRLTLYGTVMPAAAQGLRVYARGHAIEIVSVSTTALM